LRLHEAKKDLYRRLAKEQGYRSRAAFKLIQANEKYGLIRQGDKVVDFGAAPGGWLQVVSRMAGKSGLVLGVDTRPVKRVAPNVLLLTMDVNDEHLAESILSATHEKADVILSDLSPSVSGTWELDHYKQIEMTFRVFGLFPTLLRDEGRAFLKVFDGERLNEVRDSSRQFFKFSTLIKADASRKQSSELYLVCLGFKGGNSSLNPSAKVL
jgi:23S rRNA (uridine2552-2'-O)-methyltransferase